MRLSTRLVPLLVASVLCGCTGGIKVPAAQQPRLLGVQLVGNQICGDLTSAGTTYTFTCTPLPTIESTGWLLTPAYTPSVANPQRLHPNRVAIISVSTPSLTELDVELARQGSASNLALDELDPNLPGVPREVAGTRQVGVSNVDDGNAKTWKIAVNVSTCADVRHLQIFNRSGGARSNALSVYLIRDPNEEICVGGSGGGVGYAKAGMGEPVTPRPGGTGGCPGGGNGTLFQVCENCANLHPPELNFYSAGTYCSWSEVLAVYGYSGPATVKPQTCTLRQVASKEACEGP